MPPVAPICIVTAFTCSEVALAIQRRAAKADSTAQDAGSLRLLWLTISGSITLVFVLWPNGPRLPAGFPWQGAGVGVFVVGSALRRWAIWQLGRFFTVNVALARDHRVVDTGPFRHIRHPSYLGLLLQLGGLGLTFGAVLPLVLVTIPPLVAILRRISIEEAALLAHLPESYSKYRVRTKKLVPFLF